jgi:hypothetical protein
MPSGSLPVIFGSSPKFGGEAFGAALAASRSGPCLAGPTFFGYNISLNHALARP